MLIHFLQLTWHTITAHILFFIELILAIVILISLFFFRKQKPVQVSALGVPQPVDSKKKSSITITSQDIKAIAGDDVITTQLDLARAYIEIGKKKLAKKILDHVIEHGNVSQKQTAQHLMMVL